MADKATYKKIVSGHVVQLYNDNSVCVGQSFIADGDVEYEDMGCTPLESIEVDTESEEYQPMNMVQPKQIPNKNDAVKFVCPKCSKTHLEAIMDGSHNSQIEAMYKDGGVEYGDTVSHGDLDRFQCEMCGYVIKDIVDEPVRDDEELIEWLKANCNQE